MSSNVMEVQVLFCVATGDLVIGLALLLDLKLDQDSHGIVVLFLFFFLLLLPLLLIRGGCL